MINRNKVARIRDTQVVPVEGYGSRFKTQIGIGLHQSIRRLLENRRKDMFGKLATYIDSLDSSEETKKARKDVVGEMIAGVFDNNYLTYVVADSIESILLCGVEGLSESFPGHMMIEPLVNAKLFEDDEQVKPTKTETTK